MKTCPEIKRNYLGPDRFAECLVKDRAKYAERIKNANVRLD